jgi:hypothetical protein
VRLPRRLAGRVVRVQVASGCEVVDRIAPVGRGSGKSGIPLARMHSDNFRRVAEAGRGGRPSLPGRGDRRRDRVDPRLFGVHGAGPRPSRPARLGSGPGLMSGPMTDLDRLERVAAPRCGLRSGDSSLVLWPTWALAAPPGRRLGRGVLVVVAVRVVVLVTVRPGTSRRQSPEEDHLHAILAACFSNPGDRLVDQRGSVGSERATRSTTTPGPLLTKCPRHKRRMVVRG